MIQLPRTISPDFEITSGQRRIRDGKQYDRYFPMPDERDRIIIKDGEVSNTVDLMEKVVHKYLFRRTNSNDYDFILVFLLHAKPPETLRDNGFQSVKGISTPFFIIMASVSISIRIVPHEGIQFKFYLFFNNGKKLNFRP